MTDKKLVLLSIPPNTDASFLVGTDLEPSWAGWDALGRRLAKLGYDLATTQQRPGALLEAERVLFFNHPPMPGRGSLLGRLVAGFKRSLRRTAPHPWTLLRQAGRADRAALFLWEPEAVIPGNYDPAMHAQFKTVFTWRSEYLAQGGRYKAMAWPQLEWIPPVADPPFADRKLLVNFSAFKFSSHPRELYSQRKAMIRRAQTEIREGFEHYGPGWEGWPLWKGVVASKFEVYPRFRFGLCYENMQGVGGYVTEKVFDCLRGGAVPVYWGDPQVANWLDPEAFLDRREFADDGAVLERLRTMDEAEWRRRREAGKRWLASASFQAWLPDSFARRVTTGLGLEVGEPHV